MPTSNVLNIGYSNVAVKSKPPCCNIFIIESLEVIVDIIVSTPKKFRLESKTVLKSNTEYKFTEIGRASCRERV